MSVPCKVGDSHARPPNSVLAAQAVTQARGRFTPLPKSTALLNLRFDSLDDREEMRLAWVAAFAAMTKKNGCESDVSLAGIIRNPDL